MAEGNWLEEDQDAIMEQCLQKGEEMHWKGQIHRIESVSRPFLQNGIRLIQNLALLEGPPLEVGKKLSQFTEEVDEYMGFIQQIKDFPEIDNSYRPTIPLERRIVPGSKTLSVIEPVLDAEEGKHIGALFDLDRTLIKGFSASKFFQSRLLSGRMTTKELLMQFSGFLVYAISNDNFSKMASIGARGVTGLPERVFTDLGEEIYLKHLAKSIYSESRALVEAHRAKGHTLAIISAATPYQVNPIARDLGIEHILCTRMEVDNGKFTGSIIEPACWGEGKAIAARQLAENEGLDLTKSHFYTDSAEDLPLLEIVGYPHALNPDAKLSSIAFQNDWPVSRFDDVGRPNMLNYLRTAMAFGSLIPAAWAGLAMAAVNMSRSDGVNSMMSVVGDLGTRLAGIRLLVKGEENLWAQRPAVFIFNHQSNADFFIVTKLLRKDALAIAKKELKMTPVGPLFMAAGVIFVDRKNREQAIEAMKPAVDALKNGKSVAIAPEGTRSYDYNLGPFKKGAFHLAMQAGVPLVPIIIKNAHDVMPRGKVFIKPTNVEVVIGEPIPTTSWNREDLDHHIEEVRAVFLHELHQEELAG